MHKSEIPVDVLLDILFDDLETANDKLRPFGYVARWADATRGTVDILSIQDGATIMEGFGETIPTTPPTNYNQATIDLIQAYSSTEDAEEARAAAEDADIRARYDTVDSTSNARTVNNVMRHGYRVLNQEEKDDMQAIKDKGLEFWSLVDNIGNSRELSNAKTRIEEAVMWAVKHVTK